MEPFQDEPMTSVKASEFSGNEMVIENLDDMDRARRKRKKKRRKRLERLGKLAVAVCCIGIVVAIVLTVALTEAAIAVATPAVPTPAPTPMPVVPTYKPTMKHPTPHTPPPHTPFPTVYQTPSPTRSAAPSDPVEDQYVLTPDQDTYIFTEGDNKQVSFGKEPTFLVQHGMQATTIVPNTYALLTFDGSALPSKDRLAVEGKTAMLKLYHQEVDPSEQDREPSPIIISRMPLSDLTIETLHGGSYNPASWVDGSVELVEPVATEVVFDITDLVFNDNFDNNQFFFMLESRSQPQESGDRFFSRESDHPPELILDHLLPV